MGRYIRRTHSIIYLLKFLTFPSKYAYIANINILDCLITVIEPPKSGKSSFRNSLQIILYCQRRDEHCCCHRPMAREHAWAFSPCEKIKKFPVKENAFQCSKEYQCIKNRFPVRRISLMRPRRIIILESE